MFIFKKYMLKKPSKLKLKIFIGNYYKDYLDKNVPFPRIVLL
jgi:hypothetical protein